MCTKTACLTCLTVMCCAAASAQADNPGVSLYAYQISTGNVVTVSDFCGYRYEGTDYAPCRFAVQGDLLFYQGVDPNAGYSPNTPDLGRTLNTYNLSTGERKTIDSGSRVDAVALYGDKAIASNRSSWDLTLYDLQAGTQQVIGQRGPCNPVMDAA